MNMTAWTAIRLLLESSVNVGSSLQMPASQHHISLSRIYSHSGVFQLELVKMQNFHFVGTVAL